MVLRNSAAGFLAVGMLAMAADLAAQAPSQERGARFLGARAGAPGRVVRSAPYSADLVTEVTGTLPDGNRIHQVSQSRVYRDGEGRTRTEQSLSGLGAIAPGSNLPNVVFLQDPAAGTSYALDTTRKTATKTAWPRVGRGSAAGRMDTRQAGGAVRRESLGRQTMEGVAADGTRITSTIPAGQVGNEQPIVIVTERWYAPDLQVYLLTRHSDPRAGETLTRLTNLTRGEPARALFEVPADFKVTEESWYGRPALPAR